MIYDCFLGLRKAVKQLRRAKEITGQRECGKASIAVPY